jgi:hypothetical protein
MRRNHQDYPSIELHEADVGIMRPENPVMMNSTVPSPPYRAVGRPGTPH